MKLFAKLVSLTAAICLMAGSFAGVGFVSRSLIRGSNLILYNGTIDTAQDFIYNDAYNTNRTYVNDLGMTITPLSTNSVTGAIHPSFNRDSPLLAVDNGWTATNVTISAAITANSLFTNTISLVFIRSANNGVDYDTTSTFSFTITPNSTNLTVLTTNLPITLLSGSSHIRLYKVSLAANPQDNGNVTINRLSIGSFGD